MGDDERRVFVTADRVMAVVALLGVVLAAAGISQDVDGLAIGGVLTVFVALTWLGLAF